MNKKALKYLINILFMVDLYFSPFISIVYELLSTCLIPFYLPFLEGINQDGYLM